MNERAAHGIISNEMDNMESKALPSAPKTHEVRPQSPLTILYAQSNPRIREFSQRVFSKIDEVTMASSVEEAKEILLDRARKGEAPFDLVISDYFFPHGQNGVQLARYIKDNPFGNPFFAMVTAGMHDLWNDYPEKQLRGEGVHMELVGMVDAKNLAAIKKEREEYAKVQMQDPPLIK
jgi:CheY-like chemotaxis protein